MMLFVAICRIWIVREAEIPIGDTRMIAAGHYVSRDIEITLSRVWDH